MKKLLTILCASLLVFSAFAQSADTAPKSNWFWDYKAPKKSIWDRYFETGVDVKADVSNSYFALSDLLTETIVLDLNKMYESMSLTDGLYLNVGADVNVFMNLNLPKFKLGFSTGTDNLKLGFRLDKELVSFLANGIELNKDTSVGLGLGASAFAQTSVNVGFQLGRLWLNIKPSYYVPLLYIPFTETMVTLKNVNGTLTAVGNLDAKVYSVLPLNELVSGDMSNIDPAKIAMSGGVDIAVDGKFALFNWLDIVASLDNIPIVPARPNGLGYDAELKINMTKPLLEQLSGMSSSGLDYTSTLDGKPVDLTKLSASDIPTGVGLASKAILRPFYLKAGATLRPFGGSTWLIVTPQIGFHLDGSQPSLFGFDYDCNVTSWIGPFRPFFNTKREKNIFRQELGFALNLRLIELDLMVSSQSADFLKSFAGSGLGVGVGVRFGF